VQGGAVNTPTIGTEKGFADELRALVPAHAWIMIGVLAVGSILLFFRWFLKQHEFSSTMLEDWGHSYAVPLVSLGMIWARRKELKGLEAQTFWAALPPFLAGIGAYFFFVVGVPNHLGQGLAIVLTLGSLALLMTGPLIFRILFLPILYLCFAITISEQIMIKATFPLQAIAAKGAELMLVMLQSVFDYDIEREGVTLHIFYKGEDIPLNVAEQCSGMRMVVAFLALSAVMSLQNRFWWQRIALILLATPVAVFLNVIRVGVLGLASLYSRGLATGDAHMLIGTLLLVPGLFLFLACSWSLEKMIVDEKGAST
jgi:exosortase